ncbi:MAG: cobalamin-binding protein [Candidatus Stahlbacteria bacterium]|nr:cobalamin-binding protein [Candidatus Stahlbacteria bacterium]
MRVISFLGISFLGVSILAETKPISRVVSLVPSVTETIYAIGAQDKLVGVVTPCDYPPGIDLPIVGNFSFPNLESIVALKPDMVFITGGEQKYLQPKLKELGITAIIIDPQNLDEIYGSIMEIGTLLGKLDKADSLVKIMKQEFEVLQKYSPPKRRKVLIELSDNPLFTCGQGSFLDELITDAQAINIAQSIDKPYPIVSSEFVVKQNPDVIIVMHSMSNPAARMGWQKVNAVKNNRIYTDIDPNIILRPGPRVIQGIKELKQRIYPELKIYD